MKLCPLTSQILRLGAVSVFPKQVRRMEMASPTRLFWVCALLLLRVFFARK